MQHAMTHTVPLPAVVLIAGLAMLAGYQAGSGCPFESCAQPRNPTAAAGWQPQKHQTRSAAGAPTSCPPCSANPVSVNPTAVPVPAVTPAGHRKTATPRHRKSKSKSKRVEQAQTQNKQRIVMESLSAAAPRDSLSARARDPAVGAPAPAKPMSVVVTPAITPGRRGTPRRGDRVADTDRGPNGRVPAVTVGEAEGAALTVAATVPTVPPRVQLVDQLGVPAEVLVFGIVRDAGRVIEARLRDLMPLGCDPGLAVTVKIMEGGSTDNTRAVLDRLATEVARGAGGTLGCVQLKGQLARKSESRKGAVVPAAEAAFEAAFEAIEVLDEPAGGLPAELKDKATGVEDMRVIRIAWLRDQLRGCCPASRIPHPHACKHAARRLSVWAHACMQPVPHVCLSALCISAGPLALHACMMGVAGLLP